MSKSVIIDNLVNDQLYGFRIFPRNLKGQYQTELDGATATATPKAIDPVFGNNSWEVINLASTTNTIPSTWHVGDTKDITLATGETLTMQIYGFNHDDLSDGSGKAGITLGMKNLMADTKRMNSTATNIGSFVGSEMYSWLQNNLFNSLPSNLKPYIKSINKRTTLGNKSSEIRIDSMDIFLFSQSEVSDKVTSGSAEEGLIYPIFTTDFRRKIKYLSNGAGAVSRWWNRSPWVEYSGQFCYIAEDGITGATRAETHCGVCFGFCI